MLVLVAGVGVDAVMVGVLLTETHLQYCLSIKLDASVTDGIHILTRLELQNINQSDMLAIFIVLILTPAYSQSSSSLAHLTQSPLNLPSLHPDQDYPPSSDHFQAAAEANIMSQGESSHGQQQPKHHEIDIPGAGLSIIFIFGSLLYGAILKAISRLASIPYNPLLLISGIFLGMNHLKLGVLGESIKLISSASPTGILAIFLPVLIFESSFRTEWHIFKKLAGQSLILGILSSLVSAAFIMLLVKLSLDPENKFYGWDEAFIMGSIITCTDLLSFVNRLKRAGTPQKLTSLLEGESLFNYCTCVLIVELMHYYKEVKETAGFWEYLNLFLMEVGGGVLLGVTVGVIAVYCIKRMIYDGILVVTLMVIFTYSIYLFAEFSTFRISGITSLAVFGLYMNAFGKTWLFGQTQEFVNSFWSYLVFVGETNIFMIAGVMVGSTLPQLSLIYKNINIHSEVLSSFYIYLFAVVARFTSISVFIKYLRRLGEGLNWKEIILLTVAGLKGAIGIALAMQIFKSKDFSEVASYLVMIHVTANSLLTLIIHGLSAGLMVKILGLSSLKKVQYKFFKEYLFSFKASLHERMEHMKMEASEGNMIQWDEVQTQIGLPTYLQMTKKTEEIISNRQFKDQSKFEKSLMFKLETALNEHHRIQMPIQQQLSEKNALFDLEVQFRKRFIKDLIAKYWQFHDANETTPAALMLLIQSANYDLDRQAQQIESWNWIKNQISFNIRIFSQLMKVTFINELAKSYLFEYVSYCYDVVSSYVKANEEVRSELSLFYQKSEHKNEDVESLILHNILRESEENQKEAQFFMANYLEPSFPEIEKQVKTRKVSFFILHTFKNIIDKNNENGQLQPNQYDMLNHIIDSKSLNLNLSSPKWEEPNLFHILSQDKPRNVFKGLPSSILYLLSGELGEPFTFDANEVIIDNAEIGKYVFLVKKGGCIVQFTNDNMVYKEPMLAGQVFGFQGLVTNAYHSKATANTMAEIVQVKKNYFLKIFDSFPSIQEIFWKTHIFQCYKMFVKKEDISYRISHIHKDTLEHLVSAFKLVRLQPGIIENPQEDMIFIRGNVDVTYREEKSQNSGSLSYKKMSRDMDTFSTTSEAVTPFYFVSRLREITIRIKQPSLFLVGQLDYEIFQVESMRLSRNSWKKPGKKESLT